MLGERPTTNKIRMANRLKLEQQKLILRLLCEGNSIRSTSRVTGCHKNTVEKVVFRFGNACQEFMDERLRGLTLTHVEVDEIWTIVAKKQARLTISEREERHDIGDIYLWTCLDQHTKLIATHVVGKRSADMARRLMLDLSDRIELPKPHESDDHAFEQRQYATILQISTDGSSHDINRTATVNALAAKSKPYLLSRDSGFPRLHSVRSRPKGRRLALRGSTAR